MGRRRALAIVIGVGIFHALCLVALSDLDQEIADLAARQDGTEANLVMVDRRNATNSAVGTPSGFDGGFDSVSGATVAAAPDEESSTTKSPSEFKSKSNKDGITLVTAPSGDSTQEKKNASENTHLNVAFAQNPAGTNLSYFLSRSRPYSTNHTIGFTYPCHERKTPRHQVDRYFDFATHISSSLNILVVGDSVAVQLGRGLMLAGGAAGERVLEHVHHGHRREFEIVGAARTRGGGIAAFWRMLAFWTPATRGKRLPHGIGWWMAHGERLANFTREHGLIQDRFHVLVFRVSHPWLPMHRVDSSRLEATVRMARDMMGIETTILLTTPLNNNIITAEQLQQLREMNQRIRDFATSAKGDVRICDMEKYVDQVIAYNAAVGLGGKLSEPVFLHKLNKTMGKAGMFARSIAQACAEIVPDGSNDCAANSYFSDGIHLCLETLGPRLYAAIACLIQCPPRQKACNDGCNEHFLGISGLERLETDD